MFKNVSWRLFILHCSLRPLGSRLSYSARGLPPFLNPNILSESFVHNRTCLQYNCKDQTHWIGLLMSTFVCNLFVDQRHLIIKYGNHLTVKRKSVEYVLLRIPQHIFALCLQHPQNMICALSMLLKSNHTQGDVSEHFSSLQETFSVHLGNESSRLVSQHLGWLSTGILAQNKHHFNKPQKIVLRCVCLWHFICKVSTSTPGVEGIWHLLPPIGWRSSTHIPPILHITSF